jgi:hypothetical protein
LAAGCRTPSGQSFNDHQWPPSNRRACQKRRFC